MNIFSDISLFWLIPIVVGAILLSIWYYKNQNSLKDISTWQRRILIGLRSGVIILLLLILFGILFETRDKKNEKPVIITLVDNSASMLNYSDSSQVKKQITKLRDKLKSDYKDKFDVIDYNFSKTISDSSLTLDKKQTNINAAFEEVFNKYYNRNIGGICLVSDGNYNVGASPIYSAKKIALTPVYSIAVGDSLDKEDALIAAVTANEIAFYNNEFPIEIDLKATKLKGAKGVIRVVSNESTIASKRIEITEDDYFKSEQFLINAEKIGYVNYKVEIELDRKEYTQSNNSELVYIEIIDARNKVLMLANGPHPDFSAIRSVLDKDDRTEVKSFLFNDWDKDLTDVELVVISPGSGEDWRTLVNTLSSKKIPVFILIQQNTGQSILKLFNTGLKTPSNPSVDNVQGYVNSKNQLFELSEEVDKMLVSAPPIQVPFGKIEFTGDKVINQRIAGVRKEDPVIGLTNVNGQKVGFLLGEGIWRWKINEFSRNKSNKGFTELIQKISQYLSVKNNTEPLRVQLPKKAMEGEDVKIRAEFYNESLEPIVTPDIEFNLTGKESIKYIFAKLNKSYELNLGQLEAGVYQWTASTNYNNKKYTKSGTFFVSTVNIENRDTKSNITLLDELSNQTDGKRYGLNDLDQFLADLSNKEDIVTLSYTESNFHELIDWSWFFGLIIVLLGVEWFLRRYLGSY